METRAGDPGAFAQFDLGRVDSPAFVVDAAKLRARSGSIGSHSRADTALAKAATESSRIACPSRRSGGALKAGPRPGATRRNRRPGPGRRRCARGGQD